MKKQLFMAVSAVGLVSSMSANAHDDSWYLRGNVGYGAHSDAEITGGMVSNVHGNGLQSIANVAGSLGIGYGFGNNWRLELDGDTLWTDLGSISQIPSTSAKLRTNSLMLNALYDFDDFGAFKPYLGAGLGLVQGEASLVAHDFLNPSPTIAVNPACIGARTVGEGVSCDINDKDTGIGWQLLAGLGYDISDNLVWDTHYTYLNAPSLDLEGARINGVSGASTPISASLENVAAHTVMTGLRWKFGHNDHVKKAMPAPMPVANYQCWDGAMVFNANQCAPKPAPVVETVACWDGSTAANSAACPVRPTYTCWDGAVVYDQGSCSAQPVQRTTYSCSDGTLVYDQAQCPVVQQANLNLCGSSPVAIFNVPVNSTPKQMARLGTMPEFGDSHGLTPTQFYEKLDARYNANKVDKAYLNYLFKSMGYANGWADAQPYMFSEEVLPVGTSGLLGLGEQHHYSYSILPTSQRDREAFRIQSANGSVIHFMKTCGNYMYACEQ